MKYDLIVYGGGTSGCAAAYIAGKNGLKTLLVEKSDVLGGAITQGLVIPCMKSDTQNINTEFIEDLKIFADKYGARHTYQDGNELWFNPELLKIVFDDMLSDCDILFSSAPVNIKYNTDTELFENYITHNLRTICVKTKYIIDASAIGIAFQLLGCKFQEKTKKFQTPSLRFTIAGIDIKTFADWLLEFDKDRNVTTVEKGENQIYLSTACTWDKRNWALRPIFEKAIKDGVLEYEDSAYFQVFSMPQMKDALNLNAPRIILKENEDLQEPFIYAKALKQGRERIFRIYNFCKKYLKGFENSYIAHISDVLGVRELNRVKCKYTVAADDLINPKKFKNIAFAGNYPIDIHTNSKNKDMIKHVENTYSIPIEALKSEQYKNLYGIGRIISSEFEAQAALRTQRSCFSMGEAATKDILKKINQDKTK